jgi:stage II sporulation protein GA (sporulation sigma-E factor processing peptidase)
MLGGGIEGLNYLSGLVRNNGAGDAGYGAPSLHAIIISAGICAFIVVFAGSLFKRRSEISETEIIIGLGGKEVSVNAIVDSGNLLYDPISSLPVIIVNLKSVLDLFDLKTLEFFLYDSVAYLGSREAGDAESIKKLRELKFRVIPVKSVAGSSSILPAFYPDYIRYARYKKYKKSDKHKNFDLSEINAVIAVDNRTNKNYGEKYGGILPATLIER